MPFRRSKALEAEAVTVYMTMRQAWVGGGVKDPTFFEGDGTVAAPNFFFLPETLLASRIANRDLLFAVHGFNVSLGDGACALGRLEAALALPASCQYIAVVWPGDYWLPVVNYPFEGETAVDCGGRLAEYCNRRLTGAASYSFVAHSLGARLALAAADRLARNVRSICLLAAAVSDDCLTGEYAGAFANTSAGSGLAALPYIDL